MNIGGFTFFSMTGSVPAWKPALQLLERAGVDGYDILRLGKRSRQFNLATQQTAAGESAANSIISSYEALISQIVTIETPGGKKYNAVLIIDVDCTSAQLSLSTDGKTFLVKAGWTLQRVG